LVRKKLFIAVFYIVITIPMLFTDLKPNQVSDMDNRMLAEFPQELNGGIFTSFEKYLSDRVGFRTWWITFYQESCAAFFHVLAHPSYDYGQNNQIYTTLDLEEYQHLDSGEYPDVFSDYVLNMQEAVNSLGIDFYFIMPPSKESIYYEDYMPGFNVDTARSSRTEFLEWAFAEKNIPYIDIKTSFMEVRNDIRLYNLKYDAGHYNPYGMKLACEILYKRLREKHPDLAEWNDEYYVESKVVRKYLMNSYFVINETVPHYDCLADNIVEEGNFLNELGATGFYHRVINKDNEGGEKILIIGDSFSDVDGGMEVYYSPYFYEIDRIHTDNIEDCLYYITTLNPDIVIFEATERTMGKAQYDIDRLKSKNYYTMGFLDEDVELSEISAENIEILGEEVVNSMDGSAFLKTNVTTENSEMLYMVALANRHEYIAKSDEDSFIFSFNCDDVRVGTIKYYAINYK
jgi:hypothetical protein